MFLEPEVIKTPCGLSAPLDVRRCLPAEEILSAYRTASQGHDSLGAVRSFFSLLTLCEIKTDSHRLCDVLNTFLLLVDGLTRAMQDLPAAVTIGSGTIRFGTQGPVYDYPERGRYAWVDMLAYNYHWSRAEILALHPREAARFVQEIKLHEWEEWEWQYARSDLAYDKQGKFKRPQKPAWMTTNMTPQKAQEDIKPIRIPRKFLDGAGDIISAATIAKD